MTLNDAVSNNILNFDNANFRIAFFKNGNCVMDFGDYLGYTLDLDTVYANLVISPVASLDCSENLRNILAEIVKACENCDLDFLAENLDKFVATDVDGTIYQFYVDIFNVGFSF